MKIIKNIGRSQPLVDPDEVVEALGAEPITDPDEIARLKALKERAMKGAKEPVNTVSDEIIHLLVAIARQERGQAYVPYSHYKVGAAVLDDDGNIRGGFNIEYCTYSQTDHAESVAIINMLHDCDSHIIRALCVVTETGEYPPCGECRQRIWEFADGNKELPIIFADAQGNYKTTTIGNLLPFAFGPEALKK
ncbi:MAG: cytidine deaminase [Parcubacteria group bacterium]|nr:cytidine deaminase [Parcubacteria group bacterium]